MTQANPLSPPAPAGNPAPAPANTGPANAGVGNLPIIRPPLRRAPITDRPTAGRRNWTIDIIFGLVGIAVICVAVFILLQGLKSKSSDTGTSFDVATVAALQQERDDAQTKLDAANLTISNLQTQIATAQLATKPSSVSPENGLDGLSSKLKQVASSVDGGFKDVNSQLGKGFGDLGKQVDSLSHQLASDGAVVTVELSKLPPTPSPAVELPKVRIEAPEPVASVDVVGQQDFPGFTRGTNGVPLVNREFGK